jgi:DNA replication and repair protein RecF
LISGENGVGKTNILEAISLLAPGRSMKNCKLDEIITQPPNIMQQWGVHATINGNTISTGYSPKSLRKIKNNQEVLKSQSDILKEIKVLWLLPQMEGIFTGGSQNRRKFLDRMCYNLFPEHAQHIIKYEFYLTSRMKVLQQNHLDNNWLQSIEINLASLTKIIHNTRVATLDIIQKSIDNINANFLKPLLKLISPISQEDNENKILEYFKLNRLIDKRSKRSNFGAHKEYLHVIHSIKKQKDDLFSTGEQKTLLVAMIIAQAQAIKDMHNIAPVMLMDEVLAHFDLKKQSHILEELHSLSSQIWVTTTKKNTDLELIYNNNSFLWINLN